MKKGSGDAPPARPPSSPRRRSPPTCPRYGPSLRQHHDDIDEPLALHGRDGDAGSEGLDAEAEAEAEAAAAAAAEAADFGSDEEWGGDAGGDSGGGASAGTCRATGVDGSAATPPWAAAQGDG